LVMQLPRGQSENVIFNSFQSLVLVKDT